MLLDKFGFYHAFPDSNNNRNFTISIANPKIAYREFLPLLSSHHFVRRGCCIHDENVTIVKAYGVDIVVVNFTYMSSMFYQSCHAVVLVGSLPEHVLI